MCKAEAACLFAAAIVLAGRTGKADDAPQTERPAQYKSVPLNLHRPTHGAELPGETGRARMHNGDWAGALEALDAAVRASTDPSLRRDRGLCHEHLAHIYPAIDDYRAYLTAQPDAPDADGIRVRLERLEHDALGYSSASTDAPGDVEGVAGSRVSANRKVGAEAQAGQHPIDYVDRDDDPLETSLRRGKGLSVAPFLFVHKWGASPARIALPQLSGGSNSPFGDSGTWAEGVGLELRYSLGPSSALLLEAAYEHFNSTELDLAVVSGLSSQIAYEWRFPIDTEYQNQFIMGAGLGYEHLAVQPGDAQTPAQSLGGFVPRVRFGWRHLLGPSAGVEVALDGGVVNFFGYSQFPFDSNNPTSFLFALQVAVVWGL